MHHLTPNGIAKIALFVWAVKSQRANLDIGAFCNLHETHTQFRNKTLDGKTIIKYFGCCSFKPARGAKQISPASKNKWVENWYRYCFYHSVPLVEERDDSGKVVKRYPLAVKMSKNIFECKPDFPSSKNSRTCEKVYKLATSMQSARDFCEEYFAA